MAPISILITAAIRQELDGLIKKVAHPSTSVVGRREMISGDIAGKAVSILPSGPGMVNTAQALTAAIENQRPALIIQTGCAGAFRQSGLRLGDIAVATQEIDAELGIEVGEGERLTEDLPFAVLAGDSLEIKNCYPVDAALADAAHAILKTVFAGQTVKVGKGPFITVSTITASDHRAEMLQAQFAPCMEAMEGAAAAHVALHYAIPFVEIRAASNHVGRRDKNAWNLELAFERCAAAVLAFIRRFDINLLKRS